MRDVEKFLRDHAMTATRFGRDAVNDPRLVLDLRNGRTPLPKMERRIRDWMERQKEERT